ncbi:MAG: lipase family alpha/beta hydrolase [Steroidobacterales bacterium]
MAARFWRRILGLALALAVASGILLAWGFALPAWTAVALASVMLLAMPGALVLASFVMARTARNPLAALPGEIVAFTLAVLAMCRGGRPFRPAQRLPATYPTRPVLLLHGLLCNHQVWRALRPRLEAAGFGPIEAPDMEPLLVDIEALAAGVADQLRSLQRRCNGERVVIVGHSMGGLVARLLLRDVGASAIGRIVTIASPHHGTGLARGLPGTNTGQMSCTSAWLRALNESQENRFAVPVASIYSTDDNIVAPAGSARLAGAELRELRGLGHFAVLRSRRALDAIMATLSPEDPG